VASRAPFLQEGFYRMKPSPSFLNT